MDSEYRFADASANQRTTAGSIDVRCHCQLTAFSTVPGAIVWNPEYPIIFIDQRIGGWWVAADSADRRVGRSGTAIGHRALAPAYEIQYPWRPGVRYSVVGYRMTVRRRRSPSQLSITNVEQRQSSYGRGGGGGQAASRGPSSQSDPAMMSSDPELYDDTDMGPRPGSSDFTSSDISRWDSAGLPSRRQLPPSPRRNFMPSTLSGATQCYHSPDARQTALGVIALVLTLIVWEL